MLFYYIIPLFTLSFHINFKGQHYYISPEYRQQKYKSYNIKNITREEELNDIESLNKFLNCDKY